MVSAARDRSSLAMSDLLKHMLVSTSGGIVMTARVLMALSQIGISLSPMLAGVGVAGFIIGYDDDVEKAERVLQEIVTAHEKVDQ